jgi:hypothetical protein
VSWNDHTTDVTTDHEAARGPPDVHYHYHDHDGEARQHPHAVARLVEDAAVEGQLVTHRAADARASIRRA